MIAGVVGLHIWALHVPGNNNPLGIDVKGPQDTVPFHPYYTVKDAFYLSLFVIVFAVFVFFAPDFFGNPDNSTPANALVTPPDIVPEWYLLPFYAMLRSVPQKLIGVLVLVGALLTLVFIPWLDTSKVRSCRFRPLMKQLFWVFALDCIMLGYVGSQSADAALHLEGLDLPLVWLARAGHGYYYAFFWVLMPLVGRIEKPKALPESIAQSVLGKKAEENAHEDRSPASCRRLRIVAVVARPMAKTPARRCRQRSCLGRSTASPAPMTAARCSAVIRSTRKFAPPVTA